MTAPKETEAKIPVEALGPVRERLQAVDAVCEQPFERENNTLFDNSDGGIGAQGHTLRLRRYAGRVIVTHKGATSYLGAIKVREEIEFDVAGEAETFVAFLARLGYHPSISYEKDREVWLFSGTMVTLDHTPMGDFVEIEGPTDSIGQAAERLGLDVTRAVRGSYISLWQDFRQQHPERALGSDMVFPEC